MDWEMHFEAIYEMIREYVMYERDKKKEKRDKT